MKNKDKLFSILDKIAKDIDKKGGTIYFVGGYVRDKLLGKENKDIDVEIHGISVTDTRHILEKYGEVDEVGASFGILMVKGLDIDFAFPRTESRTGSKHTDFEVLVNPFLDIKEAVRRRDFTMNSVMQNVLTGEYVDIFGGISDINKKIIKVVDNETFIEDSLRPLRACQFASRLGFTVDKDLINLSKTMDYSSLSRERVVGELDKALLSDKPSIAFNYLYEMGIVSKLFPEFEKMKDSPQNLEFHPEGDVWNHVMLVLDEGAKVKHKSKNPRYFMYACLLHDISKPETSEIINGKYTNHNHDVIGAVRTTEFLKKWTNETKLHNYVSRLTEYHMKAHILMDMSYYKVNKIMIKVDMSELLLLNSCDVGGRELDKESISKRKKDYDEKVKLITELSNGEFGKIEPYITGKTLIDLGFKQGEELGKMLRYSYDLQLQGKSKDKIMTILDNKINPKEYVSLNDYVDTVYRDIMKKDSWKKDRQEKIYTRFKYLLSKDEFKGVKLQKSKQGIPFCLGIIKDDNTVWKVIFTPDVVVVTDVHFNSYEIVLENYYMTTQQRMDSFNKILSKTTLRENQANLFKLSYSSFKKKI